jgi:hypothetical protein
MRTASTAQGVGDIAILVREVDPVAGATAGGRRGLMEEPRPAGLSERGSMLPVLGRL